MKFRFFFKDLKIHQYFVIFLKEYVHKCVHRDIDRYPNETNDNASESIGLRASFEHTRGNTS